MKTKRFFSLFLILTLVMSLWATPQAAAAEDPDIQAKAALLVDVNTDSVVYAKNAHQEMYPASLTKVMTQGNKDNTLSRDSYRFVLEHTVKNLK